jgi:Helicase HerA, central domain
MPTATDFEKLGVFYLGREWDVTARKPESGVLLYDSRDLVTHAVCVGMTGSGKTGLCLALLEEAALDGIPALVIDPKGDLANLALTFPELRPEDFRPWVNEDEARKKGLSVDDFAREQAELWRKGLAEWGEDGARIGRFRDAVDIAIYTPGSEAGIPLSIMVSFAAPPAAIREDGELLRERINSTATSLLGLLGIAADPIRNREHILLSTILDATWRAGRDCDLATLIQQIQAPAVTRVGVLDLESFYPAKERFDLAMALNNLLAAPGFKVWMQGEPLDIGRMLVTPAGKPRISILSIAHLGDAERMFVVSLVLNQMLAWTRSQPGTTSLRAVLYMDEIFGYLPPVANPPSKLPLLTLLKQARAFGLGVVLATQNPVDLDYKGLSNAGTWLIGRLQTERDKARVLDGLEGAAAGAGARFNRGRAEEIIASLGHRIFLMNNVHDEGPALFQTRWTLSYLRGPLTRSQIRALTRERRPPAAPQPDSTPTAAPGSAAPATAARPVLLPEVPQHFLPVRGTAPAGATLVYRPMVFGAAEVRFADAKKGLDVSEAVLLLTAITSEAVPVDWANAVETAVSPDDLDPAPASEARFLDLPGIAGQAKSYATWRKEFAAWLFRSRKLDLLMSPRFKAISRPGESEGEFRARLQHAVREKRDEAVEQLRRKYAPRMAALQERIRRAEQAVEREAAQAQQQGVQAAISIGATLIGAVLGRKAVTATTVGRVTTAARGAGRVLKEQQDVGRAKETVEALRQQLLDLEAEFKAETDQVGANVDSLAAPLETVTMRPTKRNVTVTLLALAWSPEWQDPGGQVTSAWR